MKKNRKPEQTDNELRSCNHESEISQEKNQVPDGFTGKFT